MQDDLNATLVLCETSDCPQFGSCHVECMPMDTRPPVLQEKSDDAEDEEDGDDSSEEGDGGTNGEAGTSSGAATAPPDTTSEVGQSEGDKAKVKVPGAAGVKLGPFGRPRSLAWRPGDPKRTWDLRDFSWYCSHCVQAREEKAKEEAATAEGSSSDAEEKGPEVEKETEAKKEKCAAPAPGPGGPYIKAELTHGSRRLLKQYFELCATPDKAQLCLLAAMTERSIMDTQSWFHEKGLQRQREERQKLPKGSALPGSQPSQQQQAPQRSQTNTASMNAQSGGPHACGTHPAHMASLYARQHSIGQGNARPSLGGSEAGMLSMEARAAIKAVFEEAKSLGNQAYAGKRYDDALTFYQQAQRADPQNSSQMLHAVLSNMSAVYATKRNWRKSFHHVRCARGEKRMRPPLTRLLRCAFRLCVHAGL